MKLQCFYFLLLFLPIVSISLQNDTELHIGTLIPGLTAPDHFGYKKAIEYAAETINSNGLLKGYKLVFHHKSSVSIN